MATEKPVTLADLYVLWCKPHNFIAITNDSEQSGAVESLMLFLCRDDAISERTRLYELSGQMFEPVTLTEAIERGLLK